MNDNSYKVIEVDINEILPNRFQPRIQFDEEEILELSDSIKEHGVIQPLVVRTIGDKYEIIAGERRYKASVLAGKETVPVIIKNLNDKDSAEIALIENIQRKNLTPIEEALSYKKILDMGYITQENLASKLGKSQSSVANKIRLLNLSDEVQEALLDNRISERHARSLLRLKSTSEQNQMLDKIINERLTVRRTDEEIDKLLNPVVKEEFDSKENLEKKEEKGEIEMNNEINQIPNVVTQHGNTFDIFGTSQQNQIPSMSAVPPVVPEIPSIVSTPQMEGIQFNPNINTATMPSTPVEPMIPEVPSMSAVPPVVPEIPSVVSTPQIEGIQFNPNINAAAMPSTPVEPMIPEVPSMSAVSPVVPEIPSVVSTPQIEGIQFNPNINAAAMPSTPVEPMIPEVPSMSAVPPVVPEIPSVQTEQPVLEVPSTPIENQVISVPNTSPIIESPTLMESQQPATVNEFVAPEPIIITDYTKQYDPVMPTVHEEEKIKVDFKEIINAIRECSEKIEKYGYKIDVEEYDLSTLYQVVFKIEK